MPGSWEVLQHGNVLGAILHTDNTTVAWAFGLRNLAFPGHFITLAGMPYDMARNTACMRALESGFDWCFFLDSDVIPPHDAVTRLLSHNQPVISGMYCRRSPPHGIPVMIKDRQWVTNFRQGSVVEVDLVGAGCLLIHRSVLERLPPSREGKHWFDWKVDMRGTPGHGEQDCLSEDFSFCKRVREKLGIKILVDTGVVCRHVGYAQATLNQMHPLDCHTVT